MHNFKKMLKRTMQEQNTSEWAKLLPKATRAHSRLSHEALMGNADPNEAYDLEHENLEFEMREEAGKKMAQQNAVVTTNQKTHRSRAASGRTLVARTSGTVATARSTAVRSAS